MEIGPGKWRDWQTHRTTNYTAYVRRTVAKPKQRIAVSLFDERGQIAWGQSSMGDEHNGVFEFTFDLLPGAQQVTLQIVVLQPAQTEFVVKPPDP
jgi:hypothetical protein